MTTFQVFKKRTAKKDQYRLSLEQLVQFIRTGENSADPSTHGFGQSITAAKESRNGELVGKLKNGRQVYPPNWTYTGQTKVGDNRFKPTGYLYLDYDKIACKRMTYEQAQDVKRCIAQSPYTAAVWLSISGHGVGALVKIDADQLVKYSSSAKSFKAYANMVAQHVGCGTGLDEGALTRDRINVVSYDPNVYANLNAETLHVNETGLEQPVAEISQDVLAQALTMTTQIYKSGKIITQARLKEYGSDCEYFPEGIPYFECRTPFGPDGKTKKLLEGGRNSWMSKFAANLVLLNRDVAETNLVKFMMGVNDNICQPPLPKHEIIHIVTSKLKARDEGTLHAAGVKLKKFWINPNVAKGDRLKVYQDTRKDLAQDKLALLAEVLKSYPHATPHEIHNTTGLSLRFIHTHRSKLGGKDLRTR
jgi:hypothetical protein